MESKFTASSIEVISSSVTLTSGVALSRLTIINPSSDQWPASLAANLGSDRFDSVQQPLAMPCRGIGSRPLGIEERCNCVYALSWLLRRPGMDYMQTTYRPYADYMQTR